MLLPLLLVLLPCAPAAIPSMTASSYLSQDEDEIVDKRPEIKEQLSMLKEHISKRGDEDTEAVGLIDQLISEYPRSGPKDRGAITKGIGKCFDQKRKDLGEDIPNNQLYLAAAVALGEMGKEATPVLTKYIGNKKHRKNIALQRALILSLGKTKDLKAIGDLTDLLNDKDNVIIAATAEALGEYSAAPQKSRKEIFSELLKILVTVQALKDSDINDVASREKWEVISAPIITTLQGLTGLEETDPAKWQRWWNKNKKQDWDRED